MQNKSKNIILLVIIITLLVLGLVCVLSNRNRKEGKDINETQNQTNYSIKETEDDKIISAFLLNLSNVTSSMLNSPSPLFCSSREIMEKKIFPTQKVVFSNAYCSEVVLKDNDLRSDTGGAASGMFLFEKLGDTWKVIDFDERLSPNSASSKDWVNKYQSLVPKSSLYDDYFSGQLGIIEKAAQYYGLSLPQYNLNQCSSNNDCLGSEICFKPEIKYKNANTCLKTCSTNKECGIGYDCRGQCVNGTGGGCDDIKYACVPDLLDVSLEKNPNEVIK